MLMIANRGKVGLLPYYPFSTPRPGERIMIDAPHYLANITAYGAVSLLFFFVAAFGQLALVRLPLLAVDLVAGFSAVFAAYLALRICSLRYVRVQIDAHAEIKRASPVVVGDWGYLLLTLGLVLLRNMMFLPRDLALVLGGVALVAMVLALYLFGGAKLSRYVRGLAVA